MKVTENFWVSEFDCHDGTAYPPEWIEPRLIPLCMQLEIIRAVLGKPVLVHSGYRTLAYNQRVGGVSRSQHLEGRAADITIPRLWAGEMHRHLEDMMREGTLAITGIGLYPTFVHVDMRPAEARVARWTGGRVTT